MNPWAHIQGDDDSAPTGKDFMRAMQMTIGENQTSDSTNPTWGPWDLVPTTELASMGRGAVGLGRGAVNHAAEAAAARGFIERDMSPYVVNAWGSGTLTR